MWKSQKWSSKRWKLLHWRTVCQRLRSMTLMSKNGTSTRKRKETRVKVMKKMKKKTREIVVKWTWKPTWMLMKMGDEEVWMVGWKEHRLAVNWTRRRTWMMSEVKGVIKLARQEMVPIKALKEGLGGMCYMKSFPGWSNHSTWSWRMRRVKPRMNVCCDRYKVLIQRRIHIQLGALLK